MAITLAVAPERPADSTRRGRSDPAFAHVLKMISRLGNWTAKRPDHFKDIYLVRVGESVALYVITFAEEYDFRLGRELAAFAAPYLSRGVLDAVTLLPATSHDELEAFFHVKLALRVTFE